jgi:hypothetical protein
VVGGSPAKRRHEPLAVDVAERDDRERDHDLDQHRAPERAVQQRGEAPDLDDRLEDA